MKILAIESSSSTLTVAICCDGKVVCEYFYNAGMIHSEVLISVIDRSLKDTNLKITDIDKFALSCGPGSFTGIRVAMAVVKTLAQSLKKPVVCFDCLEILQATIKIPKIKIVSAIDALREELYIKTSNTVKIVSLSNFIKKNQKNKNKIVIIGNAAIIHKKILSKTLGHTAVCLADNLHYPKASVLATLAINKQGTDFSKIEPLYIRKSWAEEKK